VVGGELSEGGYIQGAGDDAEGWSHGLTPTTFWKHKDQLFAAGEEDLPDMIASYVRSSQNASRNSILFTIRNAPWLSIGSYDCLDTSTHDKYSAIITIGQRAALPEVQPPLKKHLHLECRDRKLGSRDLRTQLPQLRPFIEGLQSLERLLVCDFTGKDLAVGVTLALLCLNTSANGHFQSSNTLEQSIDKDFIKQRLSWIMTSHPAMSPSRTTLQSINDYLLTEYTRSLPTGIASLRVSPRNTSTSPAEVIFLALEGHWTLDRSIVNFRNDGLAGTVTGTATFFARTPTSEYTQSEYLYREEGTFDAGVGIQMNVNRRWIWRLAKPTTVGVSEDPDISIHFVKADGETEDYLYNRLPLPREEATDDNADDSASGTMVLSVDAEHPCGQDFYVSSYKFWLRGGVRLEKWEVEHKVKGPAKDYISRTTHTRTDLFTTRMREQHCGLESSTL
jgi:tRNA A64-2'-O-ribosylphosphate transferase